MTTTIYPHITNIEPNILSLYNSQAMMHEDERSLQRRPELNLEQLSRGGLIVGVEPGFSGSLVGVTGVALERITRERLGENPTFKLPERVVSFLDPATRRLIIVSNREDAGRGRKTTPDKFGLFAEIVELDEDGVPHHRLSTNQLILPDENYQLASIGPNNYGLSPSHIEVEEEPGEDSEKKSFVPWNIWLSDLQNWMNEVTVNPDETLDEFLKRFNALQQTSKSNAENKIDHAFPGGMQGFDQTVKPINLIVSPNNHNELREASIQAGLFPWIVTPEQMVGVINRVQTRQGIQLANLQIGDERIFNFLFGIGGYDNRAAVVTLDERGKFSTEVIEQLGYIRHFAFLNLRRNHPVFATVSLPVEEDSENVKDSHGIYYSYNNEWYAGLLNKIKADLLLTIFLRGGAPIVK